MLVMARKCADYSLTHGSITDFASFVKRNAVI